MEWTPLNGWDLVLTMVSVVISIPIALALQRRSDLKRGIVEASPDVHNLSLEFAAVIWGYEEDLGEEPWRPGHVGEGTGRRWKPEYIKQAFERYRYRIPRALRPVTRWILRLSAIAQTYWWRLDENPGDREAVSELKALAEGMRIRGQDFATGRIGLRWFKKELQKADQEIRDDLKKRLAEPPWMDPH